MTQKTKSIAEQFNVAQPIAQGPNLWHGYPVVQMPYTHITKLCEWRIDSQGIIERIWGRNSGGSFRRLTPEEVREKLASGWYSRDDGQGALPITLNDIENFHLQSPLVIEGV